jgi:uncharacterized protein (DUF362 family)
MSKVTIARCQDYDIGRVREALQLSLRPLGGMQAFVQPGDKVLLKANLLMRRKPEKATTTHPAVVQALAELVLEAGGKPIIFDSPGGYNFHTQSTLDSVYETCGMKEAARASGAELSYDTAVVDVPYPDGKMIKSIKTMQIVLDADKIINIPKIKTHMMMVYSGAVKNLFGIIPGSYKTEYHFRFKDENDFAGVIVDICDFAKPALTVMDAIVGMEGYGPTNGSPRQVGLLLASADPYALDVAAATAIGLELKKVPSIRVSTERGYCSGKLEDVEIIGEQLSDVTVKDFDKPTAKVAFNVYDWMLPKFLARWLNSRLKAKPQFKPSICRGCGICAKSCPAKAIDMTGGKPVVDLGKCISCFCCHELCNFDAVDIKRPWITKMLLK